jgi:gas vesicle protein
MGQDPSQIRQDIEQTRGQMGETVEALGYKADVPGRARNKVQEMKDKVTGTAHDATDRISGATPDTGEMKQGARQAVGMAQENPLGLAIGAAAVGFIAGLMVPSTQMENQRIGPVADQIKDKAQELGHEAVERGQEVVSQTVDSAKETAQQASQEQAQEMKGSAQDKAQETQQQVRSS